MRNPLRPFSVRTLARGLLVAASMVTFGACAKNASVDVVLLDPNELRGSAQYQQLAIFDGACPSDQILENGLVESAVEEQTKPIDGVFEDIGPLSKSSYGFAVLLRRADCAVVAAGCTPVDLNVHRHVAIQVDPVVPPAGACNTSIGEACVGGKCAAGSK